MENAFGQPQTIVLLGGTSAIGLAIVRKLVSPATRAVVIACRRPDAAAGEAEALRRAGVEVLVERFDARDVDGHEAFVEDIARRVGDIDVAIVAFGVLGDQARLSEHPAEAVEIVRVNFGGAVSSSLALAKRFRCQGHGRLIVLSSVAGERVRRANFVYGSTKAGLDGFAQGLGDDLRGTGASVLVVRPGFVHTPMTAGRRPAPLATTADAVADRVVAALHAGRRTVWAPRVLRFVFMALRHLPGPVWRRLPLG